MTEKSVADTYELSGAVVVGVDGSESSEQALRWASGQAKLESRRLVAITTWQLPTTYGTVTPWPNDIDFEDDARTTLRESVEKALGPDRARDVTQLVAQSHPAPLLVDASQAAALIVVGSRGHGEFAGMLLGSVSEFLATHAHCPVVIVRN